MATLRRLRELAMLSQIEVAKLLGVQKQAISEWERGRSTPSPEHRRNLILIYHTTPEQLLDAIEGTRAGTRKPEKKVGEWAAPAFA